MCVCVCERTRGRFSIELNRTAICAACPRPRADHNNNQTSHPSSFGRNKKKIYTFHRDFITRVYEVTTGRWPREKRGIHVSKQSDDSNYGNIRLPNRAGHVGLDNRIRPVHYYLYSSVAVVSPINRRRETYVLLCLTVCRQEKKPSPSSEKARFTVNGSSWTHQRTGFFIYDTR